MSWGVELVSAVQCALWMTVDWVPCWEDKGFKFGGQVSAYHMFRRWNSEGRRHRVTCEWGLQNHQGTVNPRIWWNSKNDYGRYFLRCLFIFTKINIKKIKFNITPFRLSAYSVRSMFLAHLMNLWLVQTRGSSSTCSHWCLLTARA